MSPTVQFISFYHKVQGIHCMLGEKGFILSKIVYSDSISMYPL